MIIPEAKFEDEYELSMTMGVVNEDIRDVFDASFIYSVSINGYNRAIELRSNRVQSEDDLVSMLFKEMMRFGYSEGYTDSFFRVSENGVAASIDDSRAALEKNRKPIPSHLWRRAELIEHKADHAGNVLNDSLIDEPQSMEGIDYKHGYGGENILEVTLAQNKQTKVAILVREKWDASSVYITPGYEHCGAIYHFKVESKEHANAEPWVTPTWVSEVIDPGASCRWHGVYTLSLAREDGEFAVNNFCAGWSQDKGKWNKLALINGLIRIHNHLSNPGMTDEDYSKLQG
jgi:hypothetical protein